MEEFALETVELEKQYNNHIKRLDTELSGLLAELKLAYKDATEELAEKESKKGKLSFANFFKPKQEEEDEEVVEEILVKELTDEEKLAEKEKLREEEKKAKNKPKKPEPPVKQEPKISRKQQILDDKYEADIEALLEKYNYKSADVHDLFVQKIIDLEKSYGYDYVREYKD